MDDFINLEKIQEKLALNNWSLYEYQKEFLKYQSQKKFRQILISSEIGTGKTITAFLPFFKNEINKTKKKVIYISPLKSINTTLKERLTELSLNLGIKCKIEKRTSDISYITKKKQLAAYKHPGFWQCMDTKRDKDKLELILKKIEK